MSSLDRLTKYIGEVILSMANKTTAKSPRTKSVSDVEKNVYMVSGGKYVLVFTEAAYC